MSRPRIRTLKPEVWQDEKVGALDPGARLLFVGLITMADDSGRVRELPRLILGHVFPYDDVPPAKLSRWLSEIADAGMVMRYEIDGGKYLAFRHWSKHQKVDRASDSELPPPPEFDEHSSNGVTNGTGGNSTNTRRGLDEASISRARASLPIPSSPVVGVEKTDGAHALFDYWRTECGHSQAKPTRERLSKIRARLAEGYTAEQVRAAIDGAARAAFTNDAGKRFDDIELICRNGSKLESFIDRTAKPAASSLDEKRLASLNNLMAERGLA